MSTPNGSVPCSPGAGELEPSCTPPYAHIFLNGRWCCECGELDYDDLAEMITGRPVRELLLGEPQAH